MRAAVKVAIILTLICLICTPVAPIALAAEPMQVTLTVRQLFVSDGLSTPPSDVFTYQLTPQTPNAPMPTGSSSEGHTFTIAGSRDVEIGPISFISTAGNYIYTLRCTTSNRSGYTIDRQVYTIEVYISGDLNTATVIYKKGDTKVSEIVFEHLYGTPPVDPGGEGERPKPPSPPVSGPKTGDFSNPALWMSLITGSGAILLIIIWLGWKSEKRARERRN